MAKAGATFDLLLDKATSPLLLDTDWEAILQICDLLQQGDAQTAKYAIGAIKKKLKDSNNPRVALYALEVLESVVKNCGPAVRDEAANRQSMEELKELVKKPTTDANVRSKVLYLVQAWAQAFRTEPRGKAVQDAYQSLRSDGHVFPELRESDAMFFSAEREAPPRWADGDTCHRCRAPFAFLIAMKHHCRNCGQAFCARCSSKTAVVPKVAGDKEVRVCDPCHELLSSPKRKSKTTKGAKGGGKASGSSPVQQSHPGETALPSAPVPSQGREEQLRAEEELQLAIALSQSEAEEKERTARHHRDASYPYYPKAPAGPVPALLYSSPANASAPSDEDSAEHPELARYLNRPYWEKKQEDFSSEACRRGPTPSAPAPTPLAEQLLPSPAEDGHRRRGGPLPQPDGVVAGQTRPYPPGGAEEDEEPEESYQQFLKGLQNNVSTFLNRVLSNQARRRSSARDSAATSLFQCVAEARPRLLERLARLEERRLRHERLQDKLAQALEARAALEALRDEHREAERRRQEEAEVRRREQLARKLDVMRQRKRELLETQRLQAVRRGQEESERLLLQKQQQQQLAAAAQARPGPSVPLFPQMPYAQAQGLPYQSGQYQPAADAGMASVYAHHSADAAVASNGPPAYPGQEDPSSPPTANPAFSGWTALASHQDYHQGLPAPPPPPQQFYLPRPDQGPPAGPMSHQAAPLPADGMAYAGYQQTFDMQGMRSALSMPPPPPPAPLPPQQQQQQQQQVYQQQRAPPSGGHRQPQQQQQSAQAEAQLISFD